MTKTRKNYKELSGSQLDSTDGRTIEGSIDNNETNNDVKKYNIFYTHKIRLALKWYSGQ